MQAHSMAFSKLIDIDQGARDHFHVPKYQREYKWGRAEWDQLLLDIDENEPGYFMGSLICVKDGMDSVPGDEAIFEVIDGQQRLTTLSLLLLAIHSRLTEADMAHTYDDDEDKDETRAVLSGLKSKLVKRKKDPRAAEVGGIVVGKHTYFLRVQPSTQNHNLEDYRFALSNAGLLEEQPKPKNFGNRSFSKAFHYFRDKLPTSVPSLNSLVRKINQLVFVQITVSTQSDAFALFESLNNRGIPLSPIDIIKNKLLGALERKNGIDIDESFERWQKIIAALPEVTEQERFLRHFYNAFKHDDAVRVDQVPRATKSQIIRIYETLIDRNPMSVLEDLTKRSALYGRLMDPGSDSTLPCDGLVELNRIGASPGFQVLLFLFSLPQKQLASPTFLRDAVDLLCRYYVRRNVTDTPPTRDLDPASIDTLERCVKLIASKGTLMFDEFSDALLTGKGKPASSEQFRAALEGPIYERNSYMCRYLLTQLDSLHHSREYKPDLWSRDEKDRFIWTVEHVLPQTDKLPAHWIEMMGSGDAAKAAVVQERWVDRLGNLTLSGYNSDLATSSFSKKQQLAKDRSFLGHKINIGYKNGLALNALQFAIGAQSYSLASAANWSAEAIEARTDAMVNLLLQANKLPTD